MKAVILTASSMKKTIDGKKYSGKCVTAYDLDNDKIIRLVSTKSGAPIENPVCDSFDPLDVYEIAIKEACPIPPQTENVLLDVSGTIFLGKYAGSIEDIYNKYQNLASGVKQFLPDGWQALYDITPYKHSLEIHRVKELSVNGKKCSFIFNGLQFLSVSVTDPVYTGTKQYIGDAIVAVSIPADAWDDGGYYKFVAAIYPAHPWTKEEDEDLLYEHKKNWKIDIMAAVHNRTEKEIESRLEYLKNKK